MRMQVSDPQNVEPEAVLLTDAGLREELECFSELQMMVIFRSL